MVADASVPLPKSLVARNRRRRLSSHVYTLATLVVALALFGGMLGAYHPALDTLGAFRLQAMAALAAALVMASITQRFMPGLVAAVAFTAGLASVFPWIKGPSVDAPAVTLLQANLLRYNEASPELVAAIRESGADLVTVQEVSESNIGVLDALGRYYPHQMYCEGAVGSGLAVLSKSPIGSGVSCDEDARLTGVEVETSGGPLAVYAFHAYWPWPYGHQEQFARAVKGLGEKDMPMVIGGDFNMTPWSHAVGEFARATNTEVTAGLSPTIALAAGLASLRIDHVLCPKGWACEAETLNLPGSDHLGLLTRMAPAT